MPAGSLAAGQPGSSGRRIVSLPGTRAQVAAIVAATSMRTTTEPASPGHTAPR
jgi:hypothetical protein